MASEYKSPEHKLFKFFEKSRDKWKARSHYYHDRLLNANNKLRYHQNTSKELRAINKQLLNENSELKQALLEAKKKSD